MKLQRVKQSFGMILMIERRLTTSTKVTSAVWIIGVSFDLNDPPIFDVPNDAAHSAAKLAHARNFFDVFVLIPVGPVSLGVWPRKFADAGHVDVSLFVRLPTNLLPAFKVKW